MVRAGGAEQEASSDSRTQTSRIRTYLSLLLSSSYPLLPLPSTSPPQLTTSSHHDLPLLSPPLDLSPDLSTSSHPGPSSLEPSRPHPSLLLHLQLRFRSSSLAQLPRHPTRKLSRFPSLRPRRTTLPSSRSLVPRRLHLLRGWITLIRCCRGRSSCSCSELSWRSGKGESDLVASSFSKDGRN